MQYLWISPHFMYRYNEWHRTNAERADARAALSEIIQIAINHSKNDILPLPNITSANVFHGQVEWKSTYFDVSDVVMLLDFRRAGAAIEAIKSLEGARALLLTEDTI